MSRKHMSVSSTAHTFLHIVSIVHRDEAIFALKLSLALYLGGNLSNNVRITTFEILVFLLKLLLLLASFFTFLCRRLLLVLCLLFILWNIFLRFWYLLLCLRSIRNIVLFICFFIRGWPLLMWSRWATSICRVLLSIHLLILPKLCLEGCLLSNILLLSHLSLLCCSWLLTSIAHVSSGCHLLHVLLLIVSHHLLLLLRCEVLESRWQHSHALMLHHLLHMLCLRSSGHCLALVLRILTKVICTFVYLCLGGMLICRHHCSLTSKRLDRSLLL